MYPKIKIVTNNHWHNLLYGFELSEKIRKNFDYVDDIDTHHFIKYRDIYYDLGEFMSNDNLPESHPFRKWLGHCFDSAFSGVLIRFNGDCEQYQIASFYS